MEKKTVEIDDLLKKIQKKYFWHQRNRPELNALLSTTQAHTRVPRGAEGVNPAFQCCINLIGLLINRIISINQ